LETQTGYLVKAYLALHGNPEQSVQKPGVVPSVTWSILYATKYTKLKDNGAKCLELKLMRLGSLPIWFSDKIWLRATARLTKMIVKSPLFCRFPSKHRSLVA
jgi:hypothetical protein